jgi:hypothetical protein
MFLSLVAQVMPTAFNGAMHSMFVTAFVAHAFCRLEGRQASAARHGGELSAVRQRLVGLFAGEEGRAFKRAVQADPFWSKGAAIYA